MSTPKTEEQIFYKERNRKYIQRYAPDIETMDGLFLLYELYKLPNKEQIAELKKLRKGDYPRESKEGLERRKANWQIEEQNLLLGQKVNEMMKSGGQIL